MKFAMNGATTMRADLETDIRTAAEAGFDLVELRSNKLYDYLESHTVADLKELLEECGIGVLSINTLEHITFQGEEHHKEILDECEKLSEIATHIDCPYLIAVPGRIEIGKYSDQEIFDESVRVLRLLADIADKHKVSIGFEFLGEADNSVQKLDISRKIVEAVDRKNVGNVIDTYHFYTGGSSFEAIESLRADELFVFHINDAEDLPISELNDSKRLYPGEGILPIKEIKTSLEKIGFDAVVSIEIFRPEYWEQDPLEVNKKALAATRSVLSL